MRFTIGGAAMAMQYHAGMSSPTHVMVTGRPPYQRWVPDTPPQPSRPCHTPGPSPRERRWRRSIHAFDGHPQPARTPIARKSRRTKTPARPP